MRSPTPGTAATPIGLRLPLAVYVGISRVVLDLGDSAGTFRAGSITERDDLVEGQFSDGCTDIRVQQRYPDRHNYRGLGPIIHGSGGQVNRFRRFGEQFQARYGPVLSR
jgi:hypothetical protein